MSSPLQENITNLQTILNTVNELPEANTSLSDFGITATAEELNIMDGVTATTTEINKLDGLTATTTELNYVDGVTSNIQAQLDSKQSSITGGASTITGSDLTASRALVSDSSGKVAVSDVTSTELGYLGGVTSNIQTQLNGKSDSSHTHNYAGSSSAGGAATSANKLATTRYIDGVSFNGEANATRYATCSTSASTAAKVASIFAGTFSLITGARVTVKFTYANTVSSPTLNVGSTGAKTIRWRGATLASTQYWAAGQVVDFVYDGTYWNMIGAANDNDTISSTSLSSLGITATATELNKLDGVTATTMELNYVDGVTSNIQTQLDDIKTSINLKNIFSNLCTVSHISSGNLTIMTTSNTRRIPGNYLFYSDNNNITIGSYDTGEKYFLCYVNDDFINNDTMAGNIVLSHNRSQSLRDVMSGKLYTQKCSGSPASNSYTVKEPAYN